LSSICHGSGLNIFNFYSGWDTHYLTGVSVKLLMYLSAQAGRTVGNVSIQLHTDEVLMGTGISKASLVKARRLLAELDMVNSRPIGKGYWQFDLLRTAANVEENPNARKPNFEDDIIRMGAF
jgi:hypothetical protein